MRFYRVHHVHVAHGSFGFTWTLSKRAAERVMREKGFDEEDASTIEAVDIEPTKAGILAALTWYADHPDNG